MNWDTFGMILLKTKNEGPVVLIIHTHDCKNLLQKCKALLDTWKNENDPPQWEQVIEALKNPRVNLNYLAGELQKALISKQPNKGTCNFCLFNDIRNLLYVCT